MPDIGSIPAADTPSKYAYPQLIADRYGLECLNRASPGASNKEIWFRLMSTEFQDDDIVTVMWSCMTRTCILLDDVGYPRQCDDAWVTKLGIWYLDDDNEEKGHQYYSTDAYYKNLYNEYDSVQVTYGYIHHVHCYLESKNIRFAQTSIPEHSEIEFNNDSYLAEHTSIGKMMLHPSIGLECHQHGKTPDGHVSPEGHKHFAVRLAEHLGL